MGRERAKCLLCVLGGICLAFLTQVLFDNLAVAGSARIWIAAAILIPEPIQSPSNQTDCSDSRNQNRRRYPDTCSTCRLKSIEQNLRQKCQTECA